MEATGLDSQVNDYAYLSTASLWMQFVVADGTFAYAKADFNGWQANMSSKRTCLMPSSTQDWSVGSMRAENHLS